MSVRRWLGVAVCYRCDTTIALEYVAKKPDAKQQPRTKPASENGKPTLTAEPAREATLLVDIVTNSLAPGLDRPPRDASVLPPPRVLRRQRFWRQLNELLACLASVIAHLLMLLLLALLGWGDATLVDDTINLSVDLRSDQREAALIVDDQVAPVGFERPESNPALAAEFAAAEQWAEQLEIGPQQAAPNLPPLTRVADSLNSDDPYRRMLSARDPRIRREVVAQEGGTTLTEAAVARALRWMVHHQSDDGRWSLKYFSRCDECDGNCGGAARLDSDSGGTALVLQAMLGAGQTHRSGMYQDEVSHGLQYLLSVQRDDGDLRSRSEGNSGMYVHALATIALCDAYALTGDEKLRDPAQRAIEFVEYAQHRAGGWRYGPRDPGDLSVTGWQLMALHSARAAGLNIDSKALVAASRYLDSVQTDRIGSRYAYQTGGPPTPAMTAEGLLSRMYLGTRRDDRGLAIGVDWLSQDQLPERGKPNIYYWYYATQVMHHWGGPEWDRWNLAIRDMLVTTQVRQGHEEGSWDPDSTHGSQGGRIYSTALACCTLEVYYRHAPLFRKIELGSR